MACARPTTPARTSCAPGGGVTYRTLPRFYGQPLIAWQPAAGADQYEVQWSPKLCPWKTVGTQLPWGTSLTLPLSPGTWYYRVRGLGSLQQPLIGTAPLRLAHSDRHAADR